MDRNDRGMHCHSTLYRLSKIAPQMVMIHGAHNLAEFVLYELSHPECFDFQKIAFFVDNPDFNCLRGVAGVTTEERAAAPGGENIWQATEAFSSHMAQAPFNQSVRKIASTSALRDRQEDRVAEIMRQLAFGAAAWQTFPLKHGNYGLLLYELPAQEGRKELVPSAAALLAFCPIF